MMTDMQTGKECKAVLNTSSKLGGRWTFALLCELSKQPMRFSELRRKLSMVPGKSLTRALERLETDGLIERKVHPTRPPHVTYSLSRPDPLLRELLDAAIRWGEKNDRPRMTDT